MHTDTIKDGGGIRGYSSLIILRRLMRKIEKIETEDSHIRSSYAPEDYSPCINNKTRKTASSKSGTSLSNGKACPQSAPPCGECCRFLPCHYFDYVGGTSTGG
jgi:hypothetical protein